MAAIKHRRLSDRKWNSRTESSMFESTECVAPCTRGLIDVFAFLEEAHFWRRELVAGASPEHI